MAARSASAPPGSSASRPSSRFALHSAAAASSGSDASAAIDQPHHSARPTAATCRPSRRAPISPYSRRRRGRARGQPDRPRRRRRHVGRGRWSGWRGLPAAPASRSPAARLPGLRPTHSTGLRRARAGSIWLGRMVPAAMVAATRRMSAQFLSIRSTPTPQLSSEADRRELGMRRGRHNRLGSTRGLKLGRYRVFPHESGRYPRKSRGGLTGCPPQSRPVAGLDARSLRSAASHAGGPESRRRERQR